MSKEQLDTSVSSQYITLDQAIDRCAEAGIKVCKVTMMRLAKRRDILLQPQGKYGKCWVKKDGLEAFLRNPLGSNLAQPPS